MGSINFNSFKNTNISQKNYTFTDLHLDMMPSPVNIYSNENRPSDKTNDIKIAFDLNAIKNSIVNLFNTLPGERLLLPDYGCDLRQFIFEPITESRGREIERTIVRSLDVWEPRLTLIKLDINGYISRNEYEILMILGVPFLSRRENLNLAGLLNRDGFTIQG